MMIQCSDKRFEQGVTILNEYLSLKPQDKFSRISAVQDEENKAVGKGGTLELTYVTLNDCYLLLGKALAQKGKIREVRGRPQILPGLSVVGAFDYGTAPVMEISGVGG